MLRRQLHHASSTIGSMGGGYPGPFLRHQIERAHRPGGAALSRPVKFSNPKSSRVITANRKNVTLSQQNTNQAQQITNQKIKNSSSSQPSNFGVFFDIDGVILKGRDVIPEAKDALLKLTDTRTGQFRVPVVFVTNCGNKLRHDKARELNQLLGLNCITEDNVLMAHSPLRLFDAFKSKHVLMSGQGPLKEIGRGLGFTNVITVEELAHIFVRLDRVDHTHRTFPPCGCALEQYFPPIEAVMLCGPPNRWETHLQLLLDVLLSDGYPTGSPGQFPYPHLPVLACNIDLVWMSEGSAMPRIAHGSFMHCLEQLYQKFTGHELKYTAICGKPSVLTYHYAVHCANQLARHQLGWPPGSSLHSMYCIGDNVQSDICGANLYDRYVSSNPKRPAANQRHAPEHYQDRVFRTRPLDTCYSVLVQTGVHSRTGGGGMMARAGRSYYHHRDFPVDADLMEPDFVVSHAYEAVDLILSRERLPQLSATSS